MSTAAKARERKPRAGVCTVCGCQEHTPCLDYWQNACAWVPGSGRTLCTACVPKLVDVGALAKDLKVDQERLRHRLWEWREDFPPLGRSPGRSGANLYTRAQAQRIKVRLQKEPLRPGRGRPKNVKKKA